MPCFTPKDAAVIAGAKNVVLQEKETGNYPRNNYCTLAGVAAIALLAMFMMKQKKAEGADDAFMASSLG